MIVLMTVVLWIVTHEWPREVLSILSLALSEPWGFHVV